MVPGEIDPTPDWDAAPEWDPDPWWWPSARTLGIALMLVGGLAFAAFTITGDQRVSRAIESGPVPTPAELERITRRTETLQQRSAAVSALGAVVLVVSQVRARRART